MNLGLLCSGQGGQHPRMFDLLHASPSAVAVLDKAEQACGLNLRATLGNTDIFANCSAQPLICAYQIAAWAAVREHVPAPCVAAGYSVGELAAYGCVGAFDVAQTLELAVARAVLMDTASAGGMVAITGVNQDAVLSLCAEHAAYIAIINGPDHFIVAGQSSAVEALRKAADQLGWQTRRPNVNVPAHTPLLQTAVSPYASVLQAKDFHQSDIPVLAGIDGHVVRKREAAIDALSAQLANTINWAACMEAAVEMGARVFLELGPGCALARMLREKYPDLAARSLFEFRSLKGAIDWVAGHD